MVSLTYLPQKHEFNVFIFVLDETEMTQNNWLFVWKTSNYSRGRSNLRNDMNQVTNLKSLGFRRERIASKFTGSFSWGCFMRHRLQWFLWCCFWSPISSIVRFVADRVAKLVLFLSVAEADDSPAPTLRSSLLSPLLPLPLILGNSLPNSCATDGCWFLSINHFALFIKSISNCTISFRVLSLFIILE